jgi:hypothetical protein
MLSAPLLVGVIAAGIWYGVSRREVPSGPALLLSGLLGASVAAFVLISVPFAQLVNAKLDPNPPLELLATILGKKSERVEGRRTSSMIYLLSFDASSDKRPKGDVSVRYDMWASVKSGDLVLVRLGQGLFGWRYIISIERARDARQRDPSAGESTPSPVGNATRRPAGVKLLLRFNEQVQH